MTLHRCRSPKTAHCAAPSTVPWTALALGLSLAFAGCNAGDSGGGSDTGSGLDSADDVSAADAVDDSSGPDTDTGDAGNTSDSVSPLDGEQDGAHDTAADALPDSEADTAVPWECLYDGEERPEFLQQVGCAEDFAAVAATPLDASIPGAQSAKTVVDQFNDNALYFQDTEKYQIHWEFCSSHLSGQGLPIVPPLGQFNQSEYYSPDRRFILGAVTYYEEPGKWVYEISPYDTASADMIELAYRQIRDSAFFGDELYFHPTAQAVETEAAKLPDDVLIITTQELFAGITYQPLNLGVTYGRLRFINASELDETYVNFRDVVVLDRVPNDIAVVAGIITGELQTPLSHINVLSQNRGTPNMALIGAETNATLLGLADKWVELDVKAFGWTVREATQEEADAWWEANKPEAVQVPNLDLTVTDLRDVEEILDLETYTLGDALKASIPAFGGKATHYGGLSLVEGVDHPPGFAIPIYYYHQFMVENGFDTWLAGLLADPEFRGDPAVRDARLQELRDAMMDGFVNPGFEAALMAKIETEFEGQRMRFRSSTNAEDLDGFTGAGLYTSKSGEIGDPSSPILDAVREVWSSLWYYRAFEEREYRSIDHSTIGMALLVHPSSPDEIVNGVALTANIFDTQGLEPGFYINAQKGDSSVVKPPPGVSTDSFVYYYYLPGQPIVFLSHSNLVAQGESVLTVTETYQLGKALDAIHKYFAPAYGPKAGGPAKFYAMDVEFKFNPDGDGGTKLSIKQARPHPGWGL